MFCAVNVAHNVNTTELSNQINKCHIFQINVQLYLKQASINIG